MRDNPKLPKRQALILTFEEMMALGQLIDSRIQALEEFLHPRMKKGLKIRVKRLRDIRSKMRRI